MSCNVSCNVMRLLNPVRTRARATESSQDPLNVLHFSYEPMIFPCSSCARTVTANNIPSFVPRPTLREAYAARWLLLVFCCNVHLHTCLKDLRCAVADGKLVCETFTQLGFDVFCAHFDEAVTKVGSRIVVINEFEKSNLALVQSSDGIMWNGLSKLHFQDCDRRRSSFITTLLVIVFNSFHERRIRPGSMVLC